MNSKTVDLIATDPPFNKGRDFHATPDSVAKGASFQDRWSWDKDVHEEWVDKITDDFPKVMNVINGSRESYGDDMGAFLCFMGVRILEMHRVLKSTGSMYLHCDTTASHYLKELMDSIFGYNNFRNNIVWRRTEGAKKSQHKPKKWGSSTDHILYYVKSYAASIKPYGDLTEKEITAKFTESDEKGKYFTKGLSIFRRPSQGKRPNLCYEWRGFTNKSLAGWCLSKKRLEEEYQKGNFVINMKDGERKLERRKYQKDYPGAFCDEIWTDIKNLTGNNEELTGYPTQKPLALYERIINASSNEGDIVLDPFCGCATTCVAAEKLNRQWVGIDIWDKAHKVVIERLKKEGYLSDTDEEREDLIHTKGTITYSKRPLIRTDGGSEAVPYLETKMKMFDDTEHDPLSNKEKKQRLVEQQGSICQGCGIALHERYMELDHQLPRADGGSNLLSNRILLCSPCNKLKRHFYTISWLRNENKKLGYMINENALFNLKQ